MQDHQEGQLSITAEDTSIITSPTEQIKMLGASDDIAENLSLLTFEMADPEQDLSVQQPGYGATTFTCFPNLALELRLMIWRATFPRGRMVNIGVQYKAIDYSGPPPPSTLIINQESRKETLRHYLLYIQDDELPKILPEFAGELRSTNEVQHQPKLIPYSPGRDFLYLAVWDFATEIERNAFLSFIAERCKTVGKVRFMVCAYGASCRGLGGIRWKALFPNPTFEGLTSFHELEEIVFSENFQDHEGDEMEFIELLQKAFELKREKIPGFSIPRISFIQACGTGRDVKKEIRKRILAQGW